RGEVPDLVDDHEHAEDEDEQDDRDEGLDEPGHAVAPNASVANWARSSRWRAASSSTSGSDEPVRPYRSTAASSRAGMPVKPSVPSRNRATATSSAATRAPDARGPLRPASRAIRSAGKRPSSGARKSSRAVASRS